MLNSEIHQSIEESVLCWLATCDLNGQPNVSPKEMFVANGDQELLIANIASPKSEANNIMVNPKINVSFIHVYKQRGYSVSGIAKIIHSEEAGYHTLLDKIHSLGGESYPVKNIFRIKVESVKKIIAPSYFLCPDISEEEKAKETKKLYDLKG